MAETDFLVRFGKITYLYGLDYDRALSIIKNLELQVDKELFQKYALPNFDLDAIKSFIENELCSKGREVPNPIFPYDPTFPRHCLLQWAVHYSDIDRYINEARAVNPNNFYPNLSPLGNPFRATDIQVLFLKDNNILFKIIYDCFMDSSFVSLEKCLGYLNAGNYTPPSRQRYDTNPIEKMSYKDFIEIASNPRIYKPDKGGQRRKIPARNKTLEYCEKIFNAHIAEKIQTKSLRLNKFKEQVKNTMVASGEDMTLYHPSQAQEFFLEKKMEPYRAPVGRPPKKIK